MVRLWPLEGTVPIQYCLRGSETSIETIEANPVERPWQRMQWLGADSESSTVATEANLMQIHVSEPVERVDDAEEL